MQQIANYFLNLMSGMALLGGFFFVYSKFTPYDEVQLIRKGNRAAACALCGALIGFCLTVASSILHNDNIYLFLAWAAGGMAVQLAVYVLLARTVGYVDQAITDDNVAMGTLLGGISIAVGIINAACMS